MGFVARFFARPVLEGFIVGLGLYIAIGQLPKVVLFAASCVLMAATARSDDRLAFFIPTLYGPQGLKVDSAALLPSGETHSAHFNSQFQTESSFQTGSSGGRPRGVYLRKLRRRCCSALALASRRRRVVTRWSEESPEPR